MDDKQSKLLMVLAFALAALVSFLIFVEPPEVDEGPGGAAWTEALPGIQLTDVVRLEVELPGAAGSAPSVATVVAREAAGGWSMSAPRQARADAEATEGLIRAALRLELGPPLPAPPAEYGLAPPRALLRIRTADGGEHSVEIGADTPVGTGTYVRVGAGQPRASRTQIGAMITEQGADLRDRRLTDLSQSSVSAVELQGGAQGLRFSRDAHGWWVEPTRDPSLFPRTRASGGAVEALISALTTLRADEFIDLPAALPADRALEIRLSDGAQTVALSLAPDEEGLWMAQSPLQPAPVRLLGEALAPALSKAPPDWFERALLPVRPMRLSKVEAELGGARLEATRTDSGWSDPRVEPLLRALDQAQADRTQGGGPAAEAPASGTLRLTETGGHTEALTFFGLTESGARSAAEPGRGAPFLVDSATMAALAQALGGGSAPVAADPAQP